MATDLGKVGMVIKGAYNAANTYEVLDSVGYNNGLYVAKQAVPAGTDPTNTTYWQAAIDGDQIKEIKASDLLSQTQILPALSDLPMGISFQQLAVNGSYSDKPTGMTGYANVIFIKRSASIAWAFLMTSAQKLYFSAYSTTWGAWTTIV